MSKYELANLPYSYDALEPYIDAKTMEIHHSKHHNAYVTNLNKALEDVSRLQKVDLENLLTDLAMVPENIRSAVRNNGGGHYNHSFFWKLMKKGAGGEASGELARSINKEFGNFQAFQVAFNNAAVTRFGSGWAWLSLDKQGKLIVHSTPNQDTPLSEGFTPILGLDVWEHAYYLSYQNRRPDYVNAWWNVVDWDSVNENYLKAIK